ncbi:amylo-alpha-1,6-glucosidase [Pontibacter silvestris]|uniref:Amylo-alpha-1,6-glucosidase n=1 Tax=Pontibacter silvestris TaxID=2305183 RepID=A0ABW4WWL4_9BACT|nr:trehalase family glycosidase [Pontibacter silvestris]MCC9136928.1 trehalase-like protein [Pontibacter silvestris]
MPQQEEIKHDTDYNDEQVLSDHEIKQRVRKLLHDNMIEGEKGGYNFHYTKPSPETYPFQFFWDTCFHVFTLTALGEHDMAKKHIRSLFKLQKEDGFVGNILYWDRTLPGRITDLFQLKPKAWLHLFKPHMSALVQPPLVAQAVERIYKYSQDTGFLYEMLPKLKCYYGWLIHNRDFEQEGLLSIITPFESGMDWKASYDPVLNFKGKAGPRLFLKVMLIDAYNFFKGYDLRELYRKDRFIVKDAAFNTLFVQNLEALANLCAVVGDKDEEIFRKKAEQCTSSMLKYMYDEEDHAFYDLWGKGKQKLRVKTASIFFPIVLRNIPDEVCNDVLEHHLLSKDGFNVPFPLPSLSTNDAAFNPEESLYIWRGPTWVVFNWFMQQFLLEKGQMQEAQKLLHSVKKLITRSGFREYYNPFTGEGYGARDFTWSGLVLDMIHRQHEAEG